MCTCFIAVAVGYILQLFSMPKEESEYASSSFLQVFLVLFALPIAHNADFFIHRLSF